VDVVGEESEGVKGSARSFPTINWGSRWLQCRGMGRCVKCVYVCVCR
jgi:hypothetical protein